jgi:CRISPR-associated protein Csx17
MSQPMKIYPFPGINTDSLGHYLMSLGLLKASAERWPSTRGLWRNGVFHLAGEFTTTELHDRLLQEWKPVPYRKWWAAAQKAKDFTRLHAERSSRSLAEVRIGDTTLVTMTRNQFSPLFGTGGNIGRRDLQTAWEDADQLTKEADSRKWLEAALSGESSVASPTFTIGGTWFVYNNKAFNSGLRWSRDGCLSPWSFLLAIEGATFVRGGSSRRLGSRARPYAVFPFVSQPLQPASDGDVGQKTAGEFWAPLWETPATLAEVSILFQRGLARLGGRAATAPHEFAVAAMAAGMDAGIAEFVRFELRQTTSSQVYEAIPRGRFLVSQSAKQQLTQHRSAALMQILESKRTPAWFDRLPYEPTSRNSKKKFTGLRGPVEREILSVAEAPEDRTRWQSLLLSLAGTQSRIDRNINLRITCHALPLLGTDWLQHAFSEHGEIELRIASALASLGAGSTYPALCNIHGVSVGNYSVDFARPARPQHVVWHTGDPLVSLLDFVERRLVDAATGNLTVLNSPQPLSAADVDAFLCPGAADLEFVQKWIPPLALLNWSAKDRVARERDDTATLSPALYLWAFFKPFFHPAKIEIGDRNFYLDDSGPQPSFARQLFALLRSESLDGAIAFATAGWQAQGHSGFSPPLLANAEPTRLAAAMALPISSFRLARLAGRWLTAPRKNPTQLR